MGLPVRRTAQGFGSAQPRRSSRAFRPGCHGHRGPYVRQVEESIGRLVWAVLTGVASVLLWAGLRRTRMNDYSGALPPVVAVVTTLIVFTSLRVILA